MPEDPKLPTAFIYRRVSTDAQTTANQDPDLIRWCRAMGYHVPDPDKWSSPRKPIPDGLTVWASDSTSAAEGRNLEQPEFRMLMNCIERSTARRKCLVVWKLDRLARSLLDLLKLVQRLEELNCSLVSITQSFDTRGSAGKLQLQVLGAVAEYEMAIRKERQTAAYDRMRAMADRIRKLHEENPDLTPKQIARMVHKPASYVYYVVTGRRDYKGAAKGMDLSPEAMAEFRTTSSGQVKVFGQWGGSKPGPRKSIKLATVKKYLQAGVPLRSVAAIFHMSLPTMRRRLKEQGLTVEKIRAEGNDETPSPEKNVNQG